MLIRFNNYFFNSFHPFLIHSSFIHQFILPYIFQSITCTLFVVSSKSSIFLTTPSWLLFLESFQFLANILNRDFHISLLFSSVVINSNSNIGLGLEVVVIAFITYSFCLHWMCPLKKSECKYRRYKKFAWSAVITWTISDWKREIMTYKDATHLKKNSNCCPACKTVGSFICTRPNSISTLVKNKGKATYLACFRISEEKKYR